jgi:hypothetical protein
LTAQNTASGCKENGVVICKQIWVAAVARDRVGQGDPSAPAFWLPGQRLDEDNVDPYWTVLPGVP